MMLSDDVKAEVKKKFQELKGGVKLSVFTQKIECQYCAETVSYTHLRAHET